VSPRSRLGRPTAKQLLPLLASATFGAMAGLAVFTFGYAGGLGYLGHESQTCNQCHSMNKEYTAWNKGSHKSVATCQDCHAPHDDPVAWALNEADNGFWHSFKFTTGAYPDNIKIRDVNRVVVEQSCRRCHGEFTSNIEMSHTDGQQVSCISCHSQVGHMR
jgi:cytochrome c nitrite reductase small subunit